MQIHVHGNNLATLHVQVPPRLLPAELGGEGGEYHPHTWASTMLDYIPNLQTSEKHENSGDTELSYRDTHSSDTQAAKTTQAPTTTHLPSPVSSKKPPNISSPVSEPPSCTANVTNSASQNTPLVNKVDNAARTNTSFASVLFGTNTSNANGSISEGEDAAFKAL